jgi:hypothetical protein
MLYRMLGQVLGTCLAVEKVLGKNHCLGMDKLSPVALHFFGHSNPLHHPTRIAAMPSPPAG